MAMQVLNDEQSCEADAGEALLCGSRAAVQPEQLPRLTQEQGEVLAVVIMDGEATTATVHETSQLSQRTLVRVLVEVKIG
jgi:hypothetical protein